MDRITSPNNDRIKRLLALKEKKSRREEEKCFLLEGKRLVLDAPKERIREIYVTEDFLDGGAGGMDGRAQTTVISENVFRKIADTRTPQGILAVAEMPAYTEKDLLSGKEAPLFLFLENIQDPGNLGTMFRTAEAAGAAGIVLSGGCVDPFNPKTVRATMSSLFRVPFVTAPDLAEAVRLFMDAGVRFYAAAAEGSVCYDRVSYVGPCAVLIGNEANGLKPETIKLAASSEGSRCISIPMKGRIESLNAAMAAGILLYEAARQRGF